jgi:ADP-heptose:LPS heptosyltransferase
MRKLILRSPLSPGDIVMLTAAVRDLHACYPGRFQTDVRTHCHALWENNPFLTRLRETARGVTIIDCDYPLIERCNQEPWHCLHGFIDFLNRKLKLDIRPTMFQGDIHLSELEMGWASQVQEQLGADLPFWVVSAGGKYDATVKWWAIDRYQAVVDHFRGRLLFVQVGATGHHHPRLHGVLDLRGRTDLRQLVRLVHHSHGILAPITALMHLAAAVPVRNGSAPHRPCVVIAGGREPPHWEAYPHHQFVHSVGALPCCAHGGCWKDRVRPLGDGDERDQPERLCVAPEASQPRCLALIRPEDVIRRIESYLEGGVARPLTAQEARVARTGLERQPANSFDTAPLNRHNARMMAEAFIQRIGPYPGGYRGRGAVICAGGVKYFANAWVCIQMLRHLGCRLPIELWHLGPQELDVPMRKLLQPLGVQCVDALEIRRRHPARRLAGWELKPYALRNTRFREVLLMDADNVPLVDPTFLFDSPEYRQTGVILWPDRPHNPLPDRVWDFCGIAQPDALTVESGQVVMNKARCWEALELCLWYNQQSDFFYQHFHGDKETYHLAFRKLNRPFSMPATPLLALQGTLCQHDFHGRRIFQHRYRAKWTLTGQNPRIRGFRQERLCRSWLRQLRNQWQGRIVDPDQVNGNLP